MAGSRGLHVDSWFDFFFSSPMHYYFALAFNTRLNSLGHNWFFAYCLILLPHPHLLTINKKNPGERIGQLKTKLLVQNENSVARENATQTLKGCCIINTPTHPQQTHASMGAPPPPTLPKQLPTMDCYRVMMKFG